MLLFALFGCALIVDSYTVMKVVPAGMSQPDLGKACRLGESLNSVLLSLSKSSPNSAMVIADTTAALCEEFDAWEAEIEVERAKKNMPLDAYRIAEIKDAKLRADRAHERAARRYYSAFQYTELAFGELGVEDSGEVICPDIEVENEVIYVIGMVSGVLSVLHDRASGGGVGIPIEQLPKIARASQCVLDEDWWHIPQSIQGAVWLTIPGSGPEELDPLVHLQEGASQGALSGVRVGWAIHNLITSNSGKMDALEKGIEAHGASLVADVQSSEWALLDEYAYWITRHQADLLWVQATGSRAPSFGVLPYENKSNDSEQDVFEGEDVFGEDVFGEDVFGEDDSSESSNSVEDEGSEAGTSGDGDSEQGVKAVEDQDEQNSGAKGSQEEPAPDRD